MEIIINNKLKELLEKNTIYNNIFIDNNRIYNDIFKNKLLLKDNLNSNSFNKIRVDKYYIGKDLDIFSIFLLGYNIASNWLLKLKKKNKEKEFYVIMEYDYSKDNTNVPEGFFIYACDLDLYI